MWWLEIVCKSKKQRELGESLYKATNYKQMKETTFAGGVLWRLMFANAAHIM